MLTFYQICFQFKAACGNCILTTYVRISFHFEVPQTSAPVMFSGRFCHYSRPTVRPTGSKVLFVDDNMTGPLSCLFISKRCLHSTTLLFMAWCLGRAIALLLPYTFLAWSERLLYFYLTFFLLSLGTCEDMGPITHLGFYPKINVPRTKQHTEHGLLPPSVGKKGMLCYSRRNGCLRLLSLAGVRNVVILIVTPLGG